MRPGSSGVGQRGHHLPRIAEAEHGAQNLLTLRGSDTADRRPDHASRNVMEEVLTSGPRSPVDGVLCTRNGSVVLRCHEENGVRCGDPIASLSVHAARGDSSELGSGGQCAALHRARERTEINVVDVVHHMATHARELHWPRLAQLGHGGRRQGRRRAPSPVSTRQYTSKIPTVVRTRSEPLRSPPKPHHVEHAYAARH
jgi:hypothetical protein